MFAALKIENDVLHNLVGNHLVVLIYEEREEFPYL